MTAYVVGATVVELEVVELDVVDDVDEVDEPDDAMVVELDELDEATVVLDDCDVGVVEIVEVVEPFVEVVVVGIAMLNRLVDDAPPIFFSWATRRVTAQVPFDLVVITFDLSEH